ncbi:hypothetical protein GGI12_005903, partial [Dipsacomyces acuminosporus]
SRAQQSQPTTPNYPYQQQQQQQQQPWSPHARGNHHFSPSHSSHAFAGDSRFSPYSRQGESLRETRPRPMSPIKRVGTTASSPASEGAPVYSEPQQQSLLLQAPPSHLRTRHQQSDSTQYHLTPVQRPAPSSKSPPTAVSPQRPVLEKPSPHGDHHHYLSQHYQQQHQHQHQHHMPPPSSAVPEPGLPPIQEAASQPRRIAVHSLLISESSSSPEKMNGSP